MKLWAEEKKTGTLELLLTLPLTLKQAVVAKFLASWAFIAVALAGTFPMILTVIYLGSPDGGVIAFGYLAAFLMAGALLAVGGFFSALTNNQVVSFILTVAASFALLMAGSPPVLEFLSTLLPRYCLDLFESLSVLNSFDSIGRGVLGVGDLWFFAVTLVAWPYGTILLLEDRHTVGRRDNHLKMTLGFLCMVFLIHIGGALFKGARLDITEEGLYTLSPGTKAILSKLHSPLTLKLYYSKTAANKGSEGLRAFNNHARYVQDLLGQYVAHSRNNLSFKVIDPRPDTPDEEEALAHGLKKFNLTETERYFFGLVAESETGTEKVIGFSIPLKRTNWNTTSPS